MPDQPSSDPNRSSPHRREARSSPYPVSRLAPAVQLLDLAQEIAHADELITSRVAGQLQVIAEQVKALQAQAQRILEQAQRDQRLHQARCTFKRIPGRLYHLYRRADGSLEFSLLSPAEWGGKPPYPFVGSYRLEPDQSWTPAEQLRHMDGKPDDSRETVSRLLAQGVES